MLELREASLDQISQCIVMAVDDGLDLTVALGWNDGDDAPGVEVGENGVGVIPLVGDQHLRRGARLGHDWGVALDIVDLSAAKRDRYRQAQAIASQMDFRRKATSRAAKTLTLSPPFAPAAC